MKILCTKVVVIQTNSHVFVKLKRCKYLHIRNYVR